MKKKTKQKLIAGDYDKHYFKLLEQLDKIIETKILELVKKDALNK